MTVETVVVSLATLVALVALSTVIGLLWRARQGQVTRSRLETVVRVRDVPGAARFAPGATLVQFSTQVCAACRAARTVLEQAASEYANVSHIDVDLTHRPDVAKRFRVMQTPTTLILDSKGTVRARIGGAPRAGTIRAEIDRILAT
ncbi:MAG: thioredoxin family protein [Salinibacterium sp.]|nr:thioredoxin family protein [Salinibacterium sp.]